MGRSPKSKKSNSDVFSMISKMLVPANILESFEIVDVHEHSDNWQIELRENEYSIPVELSEDPKPLKDGFCNPVEMLSYSFSMKPVYLKLYRRRWKRSGSSEHFSNSYDFTLKGVKMVPELGIFLKEEG